MREVAGEEFLRVLFYHVNMPMRKRGSMLHVGWLYEWIWNTYAHPTEAPRGCQNLFPRSYELLDIHVYSRTFCIAERLLQNVLDAKRDW
jgi:hypothetical protein